MVADDNGEAVTGPVGIGVDGGGVKLLVTQVGRLDKPLFCIGDELKIPAVLEIPCCTELAEICTEISMCAVVHPRIDEPISVYVYVKQKG
jgi:hypothetical protein